MFLTRAEFGLIMDGRKPWPCSGSDGTGSHPIADMGNERSRLHRKFAM